VLQSTDHLLFELPVHDNDGNYKVYATADIMKRVKKTCSDLEHERTHIHILREGNIDVTKMKYKATY